MARILLQNIALTQNTTATSSVVRLGSHQTAGEAGRCVTTVLVGGEMGSANGDTFRIELAPTSAGPWVQEKLDPFAVLDHIDSSGEFAAAGAVNLVTVPQVFCRSIFRAPGGNGTSSAQLWLMGAFNT